MHRPIQWLRERVSRTTIPTATAVVVVVLGAPLVAIAATDDSSVPVACPGDLVVHPGGTWNCATPATSPSGSASPSPTSSPSPSPSTSPTTSPSPSPTSPSPSPSTSTTAPAKGCWADPGACGYPTPATTGVPAGTVLTAYTGPTSIRSATVIDGKTVGCLTVTGGAVVIRNSRITCPGGIGIEVQGSAVVTIENVEIDCVTGLGTAIDRSPSGSFVARKLYAHRCENGLHMEANTVVEDSYLEIPTANMGVHSDGIQGVSGANVVIRHNTIRVFEYGGDASIIFAGQNMAGLLVENNLFSGGTYTIYCSSSGAATYRNNRFFGPVDGSITSTLGPVIGPDYGYTSGCGRSGITWTGNVRDDTGAAITAA